MNLPLFDGAFLIDNSSIELLRCTRLFELAFVRAKELATSKAGRNFGSTIHVARAVRYLKCGNKAVTPEVFSEQQAAMSKWLYENPQPSDDFRNLNHAFKVIKCYNETYGDEDFTILANQSGKPIVENAFALPFGTVRGIPIVYCGKIDTGIKDSRGIWSFDAKTHLDRPDFSQFGDNWEASMQEDGGQLGYCWALQKTLPPGQKVLGYIIDGIRVRKLSQKKLAMFEYGDPAAQAPVDATDFKRIPFYIDDDDIEEWREDTIHHLEHVFDCFQRDYFPRCRWQCVGKYGKCDFFDNCSLPRASRENNLASTMFQDRTWSPLNQKQES